MAELGDKNLGNNFDTSVFAAKRLELWRRKDSHPKFWDVELRANDGKVIRASRQDLSVFSPVFQKNVCEGNSEKRTAKAPTYALTLPH